MNYSKLYKIIQGYNYVSFDIFDTLLKRDIVNPKDIFVLIQKKINKMNIELEGYAEKRIKAENSARENSNKEEITLSIIYDYFKKENSEYDEKTIILLKKLEEQTELEISTININIIPILDYCINENKKILLISDMYLERNIIEEMLKKNKINEGNEYSKLFISCEYGYTKRSGRLFEYVLKDLNISPQELFHIGDAWKSDYLKPLTLGIKSYHISTFIENTSYKYLKYKDKKSIYNELWLDKFIGNRILNISDDYEKFGYECIGPILYDFTVWLKDKLLKKEYKFYNFLSREGLLLKKAFEIMYSEENTRYLCVSRKSIIGALLCKASSIEERLKMIALPHAFDRKVVVELLGVDYENYIDVFENNKMYHSIEDIIRDDEFFKLLKAIDCDIVKKSQKQMKLLKKYLNFEEESKDICVIDIGWNGTMQYFLKNLLSFVDKEKSIQGYYIGVSKVSKSKYISLEKYGYLFGDKCASISIDEDKLFSFCGLFESIFTADHGSVKEYMMDGDEIKPVFYEYEYEDNYKVISKIQKGALNFVMDYKDSIIKDVLLIDCRLASSKILRMGNYPTKKDLKMFGSLDFFDVNKVKMAGNLEFFSSSLKDIKNEFLISGWKVGFIKRLLYKFPASSFYCKCRRRRNRERKNEESITG